MLTGLSFYQNLKNGHFWSPLCKGDLKTPQNLLPSSSWGIVMLYFSVGMHNFTPIGLDLYETQQEKET